MSLPMSLARRALSLRERSYETVEATRQSAGTGQDARPSRLMRQRFDVTETVRDGRDIVTLAPRGGANSTHVLYLHGGAYVHPMLRVHWHLVAALVRRTGARVTVPMYRLAPGATADTEYPFLAALHDDLTRCGGRVVLAGDSAGGGLCLGLAIHARDTGATAADALVLYSPWVDVAMTNPQISSLEPLDPLLSTAGLQWCGKAWAGNRDVTDRSISPLNDPLDGLPPMHVHQGDHDLFLTDVKAFHRKAQAAGNNGSMHLYPGGIHAFVVLTALPESRLALERSAAVIHADI